MSSSPTNAGSSSTSSASSGDFAPGTRVRVTQQVPRQVTGSGTGGTMAITVNGTVVRYEQQTTGSWFAHSKGDKLWLDRLILKKDDGELVYLNLDQYTHVERA